MQTGLLDTSVVIDLDDPLVARGLPDRAAICTVTMVELAAGPHLTSDLLERARRQLRLQQMESLFDPLPLDRAAARSYGEIVAAVILAGRSHRGRFADLLIAAIAHAHRMPLYTRNPEDFAGLQELLQVKTL